MRVSIKRAEEKERAAKKRAQEVTAALSKSEKDRKEAVEKFEKAEKERVKINEKYIKLSQRLKDYPSAPLSARESYSTSNRALDEINILKMKLHKQEEELIKTRRQMEQM